MCAWALLPTPWYRNTGSNESCWKHSRAFLCAACARETLRKPCLPCQTRKRLWAHMHTVICTVCGSPCCKKTGRASQKGCTPRLVQLEQLKRTQDYTVKRAGRHAVHNHRPSHNKHFCPHAGNQALWLCQDRHTVFSEFFQLPPKWGALIVLACRYKCKPARSTHIYLNLS